MINNIIFDVGRVILDYDWEQVLMDSGVSEDDAKRITKDIFADPVWHNCFDRGDIDVDEVLEPYVSEHPGDEEAYRYFFAHPEDMPVPRTEVIESLPKLRSKGFKLYILSDYSRYLSEVHFRAGGFTEYFDGIVISYREHMVKPDPELFRLLLKRYGLRPEETVFIDDKIDNVRGAEKAGITGIHVKSKDEVVRYLGSLI